MTHSACARCRRFFPSCLGCAARHVAVSSALLLALCVSGCLLWCVDFPPSWRSFSFQPTPPRAESAASTSTGETVGAAHGGSRGCRSALCLSGARPGRESEGRWMLRDDALPAQYTELAPYGAGLSLGSLSHRLATTIRRPAASLRERLLGPLYGGGRFLTLLSEDLASAPAALGRPGRDVSPVERLEEIMLVLKQTAKTAKEAEAFASPLPSGSPVSPASPAAPPRPPPPARPPPPVFALPAIPPGPASVATPLEAAALHAEPLPGVDFPASRAFMLFVPQTYDLGGEAREQVEQAFGFVESWRYVFGVPEDPAREPLVATSKLPGFTALAETHFVHSGIAVAGRRHQLWQPSLLRFRQRLAEMRRRRAREATPRGEPAPEGDAPRPRRLRQMKNPLERLHTKEHRVVESPVVNDLLFVTESTTTAANVPWICDELASFGSLENFRRDLIARLQLALARRPRASQREVRERTKRRPLFFESDDDSQSRETAWAKVEHAWEDEDPQTRQGSADGPRARGPATPEARGDARRQGRGSPSDARPPNTAPFSAPPLGPREAGSVSRCIVVRLTIEATQRSELWAIHPAMHSVSALTHPLLEWILLQYDLAMRSDNDTFLTPALLRRENTPWLAYVATPPAGTDAGGVEQFESGSEDANAARGADVGGLRTRRVDPTNEAASVATGEVKFAFFTGEGGYTVSQNRRMLPRYAAILGLRYQGLTNVGSTWYARPADMVQAARLTVKIGEFLLKVDPVFRRSVGIWPDWYRGVLLLYSAALALNHLIDREALFIRGDLLDTLSTADVDWRTAPALHIHCWHTSDFFSKFAFSAGKYPLSMFDALEFDYFDVRWFAFANASNGRLRRDLQARSLQALKEFGAWEATPAPSAEESAAGEDEGELSHPSVASRGSLQASFSPSPAAVVAAPLSPVLASFLAYPLQSCPFETPFPVIEVGEETGERCCPTRCVSPPEAAARDDEGDEDDDCCRREEAQVRCAAPPCAHPTELLMLGERLLAPAGGPDRPLPMEPGASPHEGVAEARGDTAGDSQGPSEGAGEHRGEPREPAAATCSTFFPFPFDGGRQCCATLKDCAGLPLRENSACCWRGNFTPCSTENGVPCAPHFLVQPLYASVASPGGGSRSATSASMPDSLDAFSPFFESSSLSLAGGAFYAAHETGSSVDALRGFRQLLRAEAFV